MQISTDLGVWVAALFTLAVYTFFLTDRPNIIFKFTEYTMVGISLGFVIVLVLISNMQTLAINKIINGELIWIVPTLLGLLLYSRVVATEYRWLARYPLALIIGVGVGIGGRGSLDAYIFSYVKGAAGRLVLNTDAFTAFSNIVFVVSLLTVIYFFYFTREHTGVFKYVSDVGRYFLMIYFGAAFGATVLGRVALFIGRGQFLIYEWLGMGA
jgi:hypothetical protein